MQKYFEGKIEYLVSRKDKYFNDTYTEKYFFKGKNYRKEYFDNYTNEITIWILDELYIIYPEKKRIAVCGNKFTIDKEQLKIIEFKNKENILNFPCQKVEIKIEYKYSPDKDSCLLFINKKKLLHPTLKDKEIVFFTQHLPLKIEKQSSVTGSSIKTAQSILEVDLPKNLFDIEYYTNLGYKKYSYEECRELDNIDYEKEKEESEEELKRIKREQNTPEYKKKEKERQIRINKTMVKALTQNNIKIPQKIKQDLNLISNFVLEMEENIKEKILADFLKLF